MSIEDDATLKVLGQQLRLWDDTLGQHSRAEQTFLVLAWKWNDIAIRSNPDRPLPQEADEAALACILLAVEWREYLKQDVATQADINAKVAFGRSGPWTWT